MVDLILGKLRAGADVREAGPGWALSEHPAAAGGGQTVGSRVEEAGRSEELLWSQQEDQALVG